MLWIFVRNILRTLSHPSIEIRKTIQASLDIFLGTFVYFQNSNYLLYFLKTKNTLDNNELIFSQYFDLIQTFLSHSDEIYINFTKKKKRARTLIALNFSVNFNINFVIVCFKQNRFFWMLIESVILERYFNHLDFLMYSPFVSKY